MQIKEDDFRKIIEYTQGELLKHCLPMVQSNGYGTDAVAKTIILSMPALIKLPQFLAAIGEKKEKSKPQPIADDKGFKQWWDAYPPSANFTYKGASFVSARALRSNYQVCQNLYLRVLHENPSLTPEMLLNALKVQVEIAKKESFESGTNTLAYFPGTEPYLRQGKYEAFIAVAQADNSHDGKSNDLDNNCG